MLREVLNDARGLPPFDNRLHHVLYGRNPSTNYRTQVSKDRDHYSPIRHTNIFQTLLTASLGNNDLRGPYGLSNLLVRIGTGQGNRTSAFLQKDLNVWLTSSAQTVRIFDRVWFANGRPDCRDPIKFDNPHCWGQFCSAFSLLQQKPNQNLRPHFEARFDPMFSQEIKDLWAAFFDPATYKDDPTYDGVKPTYQHALNLSKATGIKGFASGITQMQFANCLVFLGLVYPPSSDEMADVVLENKDKGAFEGLQRLGFAVSSHSSQPMVRSAFRCVYDFLDHNLSAEDRHILGFSAIFVEHLLCKVSRWEKAFPSRDTVKLEQIAQLAKEMTQEDFPLPTSVDRKTLADWISIERVRL
ncbi:hypothetical protein C8J56DRAFT_793166 [Mycena floridula]|nr:hypothetical protein C8J56DRAFT_793166 [Mycena floridula]